MVGVPARPYGAGHATNPAASHGHLLPVRERPARTQWSVRPPVRAPRGSRRRSTSSASTSAACSTRTTVRPSTAAGARSTGWDSGQPGVAEALAPDFFNVASPRGVLFSTPGSGFRVSRTAAQGEVRFSDIEPTYASSYQTFSPQRLFSPVGSTITDVDFVILRTTDRVGVKGFAVFDVDVPASSKIQWFDAAGNLLLERDVPATAISGGCPSSARRRPGRRGRARPDHLRQQADRRRRDRRGRQRRRRAGRLHLRRPRDADGSAPRTTAPRSPTPIRRTPTATSRATPATATTTTTASPMPKTPSARRFPVHRPGRGPGR